MLSPPTIKINPSECLLRREDIYPLVQCRVRDGWFPCPRKAREMMRRHYGEQFMKARDQIDGDTMSRLGCVE